MIRKLKKSVMVQACCRAWLWVQVEGTLEDNGFATIFKLDQVMFEIGMSVSDRGIAVRSYNCDRFATETPIGVTMEEVKAELERRFRDLVELGSHPAGMAGNDCVWLRFPENTGQHYAGFRLIIFDLEAGQ